MFLQSPMTQVDVFRALLFLEYPMTQVDIFLRSVVFGVPNEPSIYFTWVIGDSKTSYPILPRKNMNLPYSIGMDKTNFW